MAALEEEQVMVVGIDDSQHSTYALEWTFDHFFTPPPGSNSPFKVVVVHATTSAYSVVSLAWTASLQVSGVIFEVVEGDPRNVLCEAVEKHHASVLVVGSHGYGAIKRAVLGSVSDYCAHQAHCTVMIVKRPKMP
uniref:UspA domain-containing protein n=1 Tax=Populus trichocarpa TaxID=3694 RepID=A0A2K1R5L1_POPTR